MQLTELEPHWVGLAPNHAIGITFLCPHCKTCRIGVLFDVPIGESIPEQIIGRDIVVQLSKFVENIKKWHRTGETFDTLTLTPSIDASQSGHWHGVITNGQIV